MAPPVGARFDGSGAGRMTGPAIALQSVGKRYGAVTALAAR